jgi:hypothetical protein
MIFSIFLNYEQIKIETGQHGLPSEPCMKKFMDPGAFWRELGSSCMTASFLVLALRNCSNQGF